jgi:histidine ammonia-lyase
MIAQYCAASLVSENKVLAHPAVVDSIPTSANSEDHVSMASIAARKLRTVLALTQAALAIELMVASQAVEWRTAMNQPPVKKDDDTSRSFRKLERKQAKKMIEDFEAATDPSRRDAIQSMLGIGTGAAYRAVRALVEPVIRDRQLDGDIRSIRRILEDGSFVRDVEKSLPSDLTRIPPLVEEDRNQPGR